MCAAAVELCTHVKSWDESQREAVWKDTRKRISRHNVVRKFRKNCNQDALPTFLPTFTEFGIHHLDPTRGSVDV